MDKSVSLDDEFIDTSHLLGSGVYALCWLGKVVYIGQSRRLYARIYTHRSLWNKKKQGKALPVRGPGAHVKVVQFDRVFIRPCGISELNYLERSLINFYRPKHNFMLKESVLPLHIIMQKTGRETHTTIPLSWRR